VSSFPWTFSPSEFACKCGGDCEPDMDRIRHLAWVLHAIRERTGGPIRVNSGYRCPEHNAKVGGVANSQHVQSRAADIVVDGANPRDVAAIINMMMIEGEIPNGGIGNYSTFTHVDIRHKPARWDG